MTDRSGTGLRKALKPLRNSIWLRPSVVATAVPMWVACSKVRMLMPFFLTEIEAKKYCDELAETNITAVPKRVNISITFPSTSSGDIS